MRGRGRPQSSSQDLPQPGSRVEVDASYWLTNAAARSDFPDVRVDVVLSIEDRERLLGGG